MFTYHRKMKLLQDVLLPLGTVPHGRYQPLHDHSEDTSNMTSGRPHYLVQKEPASSLPSCRLPGQEHHLTPLGQKRLLGQRSWGQPSAEEGLQRSQVFLTCIFTFSLRTSNSHHCTLAPSFKGHLHNRNLAKLDLAVQAGQFCLRTAKSQW